MKKFAVAALILALGFGTADLSAQSLLRELGKMVEKAAEKAVNDARKPQNNQKSQSKPVQQRSQAAQQQQAKPAEKVATPPPTDATALLEPIGDRTFKGAVGGDFTLPKSTGESAQVEWHKAQEPAMNLSNERLVKECAALEEWEKTASTVREVMAVYILNLGDEISNRAKAINEFVKLLEAARKEPLSGDPQWVKNRPMEDLARHLGSAEYKRAVNSSIAPLKHLLNESTLAYFESKGGLENAAPGKRTYWQPYESEYVKTSIEGLNGYLTDDGYAVVEDITYRLYPKTSREAARATIIKANIEVMEGRDVVIPDHIIKEGVSYSVTRIDQAPFYSAPIKSIKLPSTLKVVGQNAFANTSLRSITIPEGVTELEVACFHDSYELEEIIIPNSVVKIGGGCFTNCPKLKEVILPKSVNHFDQGQFEGCTSLTRVVLPENLKEIRTRMFLGCSKLVDVTIPETVTSIASMAFSGCSSLSSVTIPASVKKIGDGAFEKTGIASLEIPASVEEVESDAFMDCKKLASVVIRGTATEFDNFTFSGCTALKSATLPSAYKNESSLYAIFFETPLLPRDTPVDYGKFNFID